MPEKVEKTQEEVQAQEVLNLEAKMGRFFMLRERCEQQIKEANAVINETLDKIRKIKSQAKPEE